MTKLKKKKTTNDIKLGKKKDTQDIGLQQLHHPPESIENQNQNFQRNLTEYAITIGRLGNAPNNSPLQINAHMTIHHYQKVGVNNDQEEDTPQNDEDDHYQKTNEQNHIAHIVVTTHNVHTKPERQYQKKDDTHPRIVKDVVFHVTVPQNHQEVPNYDEQELHQMATKIDQHVDVI